MNCLPEIIILDYIHPFQNSSLVFCLNENFRASFRTSWGRDLKDARPPALNQMHAMCSFMLSRKSLCHCIPECFTDRETIACFTQSVITGWNAITSLWWHTCHWQCKRYSRNLVLYQNCPESCCPNFSFSQVEFGLKKKVMNAEETAEWSIFFM